MREPNSTTIDLRSAFQQCVVEQDIAAIDQEFETVITAGTPIFTQDDVEACTDYPARLLRIIYVSHGITRDYFNRAYRHYLVDVVGNTPTLAGRTRNNLFKAIRRKRVTWRTFVEAMVAVGLDLERVSVMVRNRQHRRFLHTTSSQDQPTNAEEPNESDDRSA